jgi:hypothetical protein
MFSHHNKKKCDDLFTSKSYPEFKHQQNHNFCKLSMNQSHNDENLPNFIERKHPRKREKRKQGAWTEVEASKQPNKGRLQGGKEPLRTKP